MAKWYFRAATAFLPMALAACAGLLGRGDSKPAHASEVPWHPPTAMLLAYAGRDGSLTRAQLEAGLRRDFAKADTNHDGCLDENEVRAVNEQRWKQDESTASPLIDFKHNGCVDFDEFAATPRSLFEQLDRNGDGKLTADELKPGAAKSGTSRQSPQPDTDHRQRRGGGDDDAMPSGR